MLQELVKRSDILAEPGDWAICYLAVKISQHSRARIVRNLQTQSKNLLRTNTLANNANGKVEAHIHQQQETMNEGIQMVKDELLTPLYHVTLFAIGGGSVLIGTKHGGLGLLIAVPAAFIGSAFLKVWPDATSMVMPLFYVYLIRCSLGWVLRWAARLIFRSGTF